MYARFLSGIFEIEKDTYLGYIISGKYNNSLGGRWNNSYIVTELLPAGTMIWAGKMMQEMCLNMFVVTEFLLKL